MVRSLEKRKCRQQLQRARAEAAEGHAVTPHLVQQRVEVPERHEAREVRVELLVHLAQLVLRRMNEFLFDP